MRHRRTLCARSLLAGLRPDAFRRSWRWSDWRYDANSGQILNAKNDLMPFNYFIVGISRVTSV
jgi:hypothetical protein